MRGIGVSIWLSLALFFGWTDPYWRSQWAPISPYLGVAVVFLVWVVRAERAVAYPWIDPVLVDPLMVFLAQWAGKPLSVAPKRPAHTAMSQQAPV